ncbi:MAG: phosphatidylserine decarboxylase [Clostridia bacterium]|nr:phosphatidylserine decarboxylase [Clostridia bacterium]
MKKEKKGVLGFLYESAVGRIVLRLLTARWISKLCGVYLDSRLSKWLIKRFVKANNINLDEYHSDGFTCFNDCFCRKIKAELRPVDTEKDHLIAPCDGLLSAYRINDGTVLPIKQSRYTVSSLLGENAIADKYKDGICLVFRLCVDHYHRYGYIDGGKKGENVFIKGRLHTVRPIALENYPVFIENCREYTVMETENFGTVTQVEVGALLVGKIKNLHEKHEFKRGEEKGMFLYGGSTVVVLLEKDAATIDEKYFSATERYEETPVKFGEQIGIK